MIKFKDLLKTDEFIITTEIFPPKGIGIKRFSKKVNALKDRVHAINTTDNQLANMRLGSLALSKHLIDNNIEPIFQITCRDRNRIALQTELLNASFFGIENVLVITGDHTYLGDHRNAKAVFDLDSIQLLNIMNKLENKKDANDHKLNKAPNFLKGAVFNSNSTPIELQFYKLEKKINEGVQFIQTQAVFDIKEYKEIHIKLKELYPNIKFITGIFPIFSYEKAVHMNENISGINIPDSFLNELKNSDDQVKKGKELAANMIRELKEFSDGVHIMAIGNELYVPDILDLV